MILYTFVYVCVFVPIECVTSPEGRVSGPELSSVDSGN